MALQPRPNHPLWYYNYNQYDTLAEVQPSGKEEVDDNTKLKLTAEHAKRSKMVRGEPMVKKGVSIPQNLAKELSAAADVKGVSFSRHIVDTLQTLPPDNIEVNDNTELKVTGLHAKRTKLVPGAPTLNTKITLPKTLVEELSAVADVKGVSFSRHLADRLELA